MSVVIFISGCIVGGVVTSIGLLFIMSATRLARDHEIYMDGYCAGIIAEQEREKGNHTDE